MVQTVLHGRLRTEGHDGMGYDVMTIMVASSVSACMSGVKGVLDVLDQYHYHLTIDLLVRRLTFSLLLTLYTSPSVQDDKAANCTSQQLLTH